MTQTPPDQLCECSSCNGGRLRRDRVSTALWHDGNLMVIEDIPALVCARCGERYFEDETAMALDMMRARNRTSGPPARVLSVPVYAYAPPARHRTGGGNS